MFAPDGRWLAYVSDETGREEIYVTPFPTDGSKHSVSSAGGRDPMWAPDGRKLFFRGLDDSEMWAVAVELEPTFRAARPELLFTRRFYSDRGRGQTYDISPDGQRFLMVEEIGSDERDQTILVLNWSEELKRLVPTED